MRLLIKIFIGNRFTLVPWVVGRFGEQNRIAAGRNWRCEKSPRHFTVTEFPRIAPPHCRYDANSYTQKFHEIRYMKVYSVPSRVWTPSSPLSCNFANFEMISTTTGSWIWSRRRPHLLPIVVEIIWKFAKLHDEGDEVSTLSMGQSTYNFIAVLDDVGPKLQIRRVDSEMLQTRSIGSFASTSWTNCVKFLQAASKSLRSWRPTRIAWSAWPPRSAPAQSSPSSSWQIIFYG